ncbi:hypothetical protein QFC22_003682 [Naganishia vaughanmartiniae]|uniref:Uncharacterized protein n=1 Tax=Naganishia vaughanmartiniae TaxID=1424756 RepID=A0ACC2X739_9TREE|nr:hypothetical protein QFC22_003682 [Naganishia vaughanmartiniae]
MCSNPLSKLALLPTSYEQLSQQLSLVGSDRGTLPVIATIEMPSPGVQELEDDVEILGTTGYIAPLEKLWKYNVAVNKTLQKCIRHCGSRIIAATLDDDSVTKEEWSEKRNQIRGLRDRWAALSVPLTDLRDSMFKQDEPQAPEAVKRALSGFLERVKAKDVFSAYFTDDFAVTLQTMEDTYVLDALVVGDSTASSKLRKTMRLFFECCCGAVRQAEFVIQRSTLLPIVYKGSRALAAALANEQRDELADSVSEREWFDLDPATTTHISSDDCASYSRCFDEQVKKYDGTPWSYRRYTDLRTVEVVLPFYSKYFRRQSTMLRQGSQASNAATNTNGPSSACRHISADFEPLSEESLEICAKALSAVAATIQTQCRTDGSKQLEEEEFSREDFYRIMSSYESGIKGIVASTVKFPESELFMP